MAKPKLRRMQRLSKSLTSTIPLLNVNFAAQQRLRYHANHLVKGSTKHKTCELPGLNSKIFYSTSTLRKTGHLITMSELHLEAPTSLAKAK